jgi:hypothetical protein
MNACPVNFEEAIGKTVGKRVLVHDPVRYGFELQSKLPSDLFRKIPRGVYKFSSHKEAEQWMISRLIHHPRS